MTAQLPNTNLDPQQNNAALNDLGSFDSVFYHYQQWMEKLDKALEELVAGYVLMPIEGNWSTVAELNASDTCFLEIAKLKSDCSDLTQPTVFALDQVATNAFALLYPVVDENGQPIAAVALAIKVNDQQSLTKTISIVELCCASIEVVEYQSRLKDAENKGSTAFERVDVLAKVLSEKDYGSAALRLVTELATLFDCDRVSLGEFKNKRSRLKHMSHNAEFGKKMNLVRQIESVMDETADQLKSLIYPTEKSETILNVVKAHQELSSQQKNCSILSVPMFYQNELYGVVVLESAAGKGFSNSDAEICQSLLSLVVPALEEKRKNDRHILTKIFYSITRQLQRLFGPYYLGRKLIVISIVALSVFLSQHKIDYWLSMDASIESGIQRAVVAPFDGYIQQAFARAGDAVETQQVLVTMDDKELRLEKLKWLTEKGKLNRQYQEATATRDRAKLNVIRAQLDQVDAQLQLVESQLTRSQLASPFDGIIVSGDLSRRLGGAVTKGELLLEVAPVDSYRVRLLARESRIGDLSKGQKGSLHLSAFPQQTFDFEVSRLTPVTSIEDGQTYFVVEAELQSNVELLKPGLEGVGKVAVDQRLAISVWSRDLVEWFRVKMWSWWG